MAYYFIDKSYWQMLCQWSLSETLWYVWYVYLYAVTVVHLLILAKIHVIYMIYYIVIFPFYKIFENGYQIKRNPPKD